MQQMTEEISKIKETSVKNGDVLMKIEKADSIPKKGFYGPVTGAALGGKNVSSEFCIFTSKTQTEEKRR